MVNNPFYVDPLGGKGGEIATGIQGLGKVFADKRTKEAELAQKAQEQQAVLEAVRSGDPIKMRDAAIMYPAFQEQMTKAFGFTNDATKATAQDTYARVLSDPANAVKYLTEGIERVKMQGGQPTNMMRDLQAFTENPEAAYKQVELGVAATAPNIHKAYTDQIAAKVEAGDLDVKRTNTMLRAQEAQLRRLDQSLKGEDNDLKRQELALRIEEKRNEIENKKRELNLATSSSVDTVDRSLDTVNRLLTHKGLSSAVGFSSIIPSLPGTDRANFEAQLETFSAQNFMSEIQKMRGLGALSDAEGKKVAAAVGAVNPKMSEKEFRKSLGIIKDGLETARTRLAGSAPQQSSNLTIDDLVSKYAD